MARKFSKADAEAKLNSIFKGKIVEVTHFVHGEEKKHTEMCEYVTIDEAKNPLEVVFMFFDKRFSFEPSDVSSFVKLV